VEVPDRLARAAGADGFTVDLAIGQCFFVILVKEMERQHPEPGRIERLHGAGEAWWHRRSRIGGDNGCGVLIAQVHPIFGGQVIVGQTIFFCYLGSWRIKGIRSTLDPTRMEMLQKQLAFE